MGFGEPGGEGLTRVFAEVCRVECPDDGLTFHSNSVTIEPIREDQQYGGQRIRLSVTLGQARVSLQVDVGFGDAVTPEAEVVDYPTLLEMECPRLRAYRRRRSWQRSSMRSSTFRATGITAYLVRRV